MNHIYSALASSFAADKKKKQQNKGKQRRNIIWFNPTYTKIVKTNIGASIYTSKETLPAKSIIRQTKQPKD